MHQDQVLLPPNCNTRCIQSQHEACICSCHGDNHGKQILLIDVETDEEEIGGALNMIEGYPNRTFQGGMMVLMNGEPLSAKPSLKLVNHSPDGFAWGYSGSGPSQLALALLLYFTDRAFALEHYMQFKFDVIAKLSQGRFSLPISNITDWARDHGWSKKAAGIE